ncbi:helix-turn-helix domain-containing protein [Bradyrhizobium sp. U87765 SZCCT0131]|uniref:YdaS family helix-turn-helix protein n=1 Tax=Bradyrhizobium sp. U87765 SZCCT0109 TaxID=2807656 RepID=UPI001BAD973D|nr:MULTISPECIES: YdaS family helix-turn-helix protein [unclassified Bradyrhizobium]MBR1219108.1 helix-turn-helix domain-containing protein [Bradyrhizobium sp. U87765 SZCCT0131]MBR1261759.1 helix-turn-helix domain-containing protein [Bradyrhizobium sp. U87765 SZCCT0134]MBR1306388.1 helix-turn-helix domain-containing protein [Bradyrhizobium sp. U87765 SZCCT0110]MBR1317541.1 helix-turn-helix domain-containing protein [Bradyrhizobium sp. U87765 SZCCT0109]MBR1351243.1 helix-turn-helix domain-contai
MTDNNQSLQETSLPPLTAADAAGQAASDPSASHKLALQRACDAVGGQKALAARLGTSQSKVWYWLARSRRGVPGEFVLAVEAASGVSRHDLRPDIYPQPTAMEPSCPPSARR